MGGPQGPRTGTESGQAAAHGRHFLLRRHVGGAALADHPVRHRGPRYDPGRGRRHRPAWRESPSLSASSRWPRGHLRRLHARGPPRRAATRDCLLTLTRTTESRPYGHAYPRPDRSPRCRIRHSRPRPWCGRRPARDRLRRRIHRLRPRGTRLRDPQALRPGRHPRPAPAPQGPRHPPSAADHRFVRHQRTRRRPEPSPPRTTCTSNSASSTATNRQSASSTCTTRAASGRSPTPRSSNGSCSNAATPSP